MQIRTGLLLLLVAAHVATGCSSGKSTTNTKATQKVGAKGGSLTLGTGVSLQIPAGALSGDVELGVEEVSGDVPGFTLGSKRYRFTPEGTTFAQPVKVSLEQTSVADSQSIFWSKAGGGVGYDKLATTACGKSTAGKNLFCGETTHFSVAFLGSESGPQPSAPLTCTAPEAKCGEVCVNTQSSTAHCGACNAACGSGQECNSGVCQNPQRTVTVNVEISSSTPARAEGDISLGFVARKAGTTWQDVAVATGANTNSRTYTFTTRDLSYEVAVGCVIDEGTFNSRSVHHFLKSTVETPSVDVLCGFGAKEESGSREILATVTGAPDAGELYVRYSTNYSSATCQRAGPVRADVACNGSFAPDAAFDVLYGTYDAEAGRLLTSAVRRGVQHAPETVTAFNLEYPSMASGVGATITVDLNGRMAGDISANTANLKLETSRGLIDLPLESAVYADEPAPSSPSISYTFSSVLAGGEATDSQVSSFNLNHDGVSWRFDHFIRGAVSSAPNRNVQVPPSFTYEFDATAGAITGLAKGTAYNAYGTIEQIYDLNTQPVTDRVTWHFDIDSSAVTGSTVPLAAQSLAGVTGGTPFQLLPSSDKTYNVDLKYRTQDTNITATVSNGK